MTKWADYLISKVRFEETTGSRHVSHVSVHEDKGQEITNPVLWSKKEVIEALDSGKTFKTIVISNNGWKSGEKIFKIWIVNDYYLKTEADNNAIDNLDNLPRV